MPTPSNPCSPAPLRRSRTLQRSRTNGERAPGHARAHRWAALALAALLASTAAAAQPRLVGDLPRGADLGFVAATRDGRLVVARLDPGSAAAAAGLADGDAIVGLAGGRFGRPHEGSDLLRRLDGGEEVALAVERDGRAIVVRFTPPARAFEAFDGA